MRYTLPFVSSNDRFFTFDLLVELAFGYVRRLFLAFAFSHNSFGLKAFLTRNFLVTWLMRDRRTGLPSQRPTVAQPSQSRKRWQEIGGTVIAANMPVDAIQIMAFFPI